mgnify:CR=1 FL=1
MMPELGPGIENPLAFPVLCPVIYWDTDADRSLQWIFQATPMQGPDEQIEQTKQSQKL